MNDTIRKQMRDVTVPQNEVISRVNSAPKLYAGNTANDENNRIAKNPFFERTKEKTIEQKSAKRFFDKMSLWALLLVTLLLLGFLIANYFATAIIEIEPVTRNVSLDSDFVAYKNDDGENLMFNFMSLIEEKSIKVDATVEKKIQKKSTGKIRIFNSFSGASQRLIKNTRLESPTHKIYRISESVVVPGSKVINGKTEPGFVDAVVYADVAGKDYDITESVDFTIPGFKGDPRYTKFKAMTIPGYAVAGGFIGNVRVPSDNDIATAQNELKQDLKKITIEKARAQIPSNTTFFPGSIVVKFEEVPQDYTTTDNVDVSMRATASVFFFDTVKMTSTMIAQSLQNEQNNPFNITNISALDFKFIDAIDNIVLSDIEKIRFHLVGAIDFEGQIDSDRIRAELAGKNKKDFKDVIEKQINIGTARAIVRPMWKMVFPTDNSKIIVKIVTK